MNRGWVHEIVADPHLGPQLMAWLDENGLTVADAATIQVPGYVGLSRTGELTPTYGAASAVSLGTNAVTTTFNALRLGSPGLTSAWLGLFSGAASVALGAVELDSRREQRTLATVNTVGGIATLAFSAVRLLVAPDQPAVDLRGSRITPEVHLSENGHPMVRLRFAF